MDRASLTRHIRESCFADTHRSGYDESQVDDFLDELVAALEAGSRDEEITARIEAAAFTPTRLRAGYSPRDVDTLLDEVTISLGGTPSLAATHKRSAGPARNAPQGSDTVAARRSALIEPRKGLLSKVFGR